MKWTFRLAIAAVVLCAVFAGLPRATEAYRKHKAEKQVAAQLAPLPPERRKQLALTTYLVFFWGNAALLPTICKEQGVDITNYSRAYAESEADPHAKASAAFEATGQSEQALIATVGSNATARERFQSILAAIGKARDGDATEGCRTIQQAPEKVLARMQFRELQPTMWAATEI